MNSRTVTVWTLAMVPAFAAVGLATFSNGDFRSSGAMSLFAVTPAAIGLILVLRKPWREEGWRRKFTGFTPLGIVGMIFLFAAVGGTPDYLKSQFGLFTGIDDYGPRAIVRSQGGYVVVGDDIDSNAIVWLSTNGDDWRRVPHSEAFQRLDVGDVITSSSGLIMYAHDDKRAPVVALTSGDGNEWIRAGADVTGGKPVAAAENGKHLAIVGESFSNDGIFLYGSSARELLLAEPKPHIDTDREPIEVFAFGSAFLAAANHKSDAILLTSADGSQWMEQQRFSDAKFTSLTEYGAGFIAVGWDRSTKSPAMWTTADNQNWSRNLLPQDSGDVRFDLVVAHSSELLLFGHRDSDDLTILWCSNDGENWESVASPFGDAVIRDAVIDSSRAVVVGVDRALNSTAIWMRDESSAWTRAPHSDILFKVK